VPPTTSHIPGFYQLSLEERRRLLAEHLGCAVDDLANALDHGGLSPATADKIVENVLGTYALPFGVALNFVVNGIERWVPMVVEEPSVIAAASNAAQRIRTGGGFRAQVVQDWMTAQIEVHDVTDPSQGMRSILEARESLLALAREQVPGLVARGGGPKDLEVRDLGDGFLVVHVHVDCCDAMGANLVNRVAEGLGPKVASLAQGTLGLRILTNLCDRRRVQVNCRVEKEGLVKIPPGTSANGFDIDACAEHVAQAIENASRFAELDPYRAATHNKGIMNGIDSVVIATGNDYRAVEAGAHAYAARSGTYRPLATWRREGTRLVGSMELPLSLGIVGGTLKTHPTARLALKILGVTSAAQLAEVVAAAGLASNFSALRALATEGIQRGHMALHARSVATSAGAVGDEVEQIARLLAKSGTINETNASALLASIRASRVQS
jgi:hydroxymethylglutaryl-CoA reductase